MRPVIIIDTETTALRPNYASGSGVIWEVAVIERRTGSEWLWRIEPDTMVADPKALAVGRFAERTAGMRHASAEEIRDRFGPQASRFDHLSDVWNLADPENGPFWSAPADLVQVLARYTLPNVTLLGAVPSFDAGFLSALLLHYGERPQPWHYRLRDIGSMAWAWLHAHHLPHHLPIPPMDAGTDDFARAMGIDPGDFDRHTALGDCRLVAAMLDLIEDGAAR